MLKINHIAKTFNPGTITEKTALVDVELHLRPGDFVTVIGGNGAGKSTLLNAVAGTFQVDAGTIELGGVDVTRLPEYKRAIYLGRVFQDPMTGTAANIMVQKSGYYGADGGIADSTKGVTTPVTTNNIVSANNSTHFTVQPGEVTPPTPPTSGGGWDDTRWPNILQHPQSVSAPAGSLATFSVVANGGPLSYQWQVDRRDGKGFVSIPGATGATLTVGPVTGAENGYQYRCAVTLYGATMYSGAGQLFVTAGMIPKTGDMPGSPALLLALASLGLAAWVVARRRAG